MHVAYFASPSISQASLFSTHTFHDDLSKYSGDDHQTLTLRIQSLSVKPIGGDLSNVDILLSRG